MNTLKDFVHMNTADTAGEAPLPPAVIEPHALAILSRSEIDAQLEIAGHRPRALGEFRNTVSQICTLNEEAAAECFYELPARQGGDPIVGASVRFAEIVAYAWGNARISVRIIDEAYDHVTAQAAFHDLQSNTVSMSEVRRRIVGKGNRRYSPDMINVTANAACAIARRNAILQAIPKPIWVDIYEQARSVAAGTAATFTQRLSRAIDAFKALGVTEAQVYAMLGVREREEIGRDGLLRLRGYYTAIKDGSATIKDLIPEPPQREHGAEALRTFASDPGLAAGSGTGGIATPSSGAAGTAAVEEEVSNEVPASAPSSSTALYLECIQEVLKIAQDSNVDPEDRNAEITTYMRERWSERLPGARDFVDLALKSGVNVVNGTLKAATARKILEERIP